jgi:hypothetical protein
VLTGFFLGQIAVQFVGNSAAAAMSDKTGAARVEFGPSPDGGIEVESYEGVLPGFTEVGAAQAVIDLNTGDVSGSVVTPEGEMFDLHDVLPGLSAERGKAGQTSQANRSATGFVIRFASGSVTYAYEMLFSNVEPGEDGTTFEADVTIHRRTEEDGQVVLDDTAEGRIDGEREAPPKSGRPTPLPPPPPPLTVHGPVEYEYEYGGTPVVLSATIRPTPPSGETDQYLIEWSPTDGLNNPASLMPEASPSHTTIYQLTVTEKEGLRRQVTHWVAVEVPLQITLGGGSSMTVCEGADVVLTANVVGGWDKSYEIRWEAERGEGGFSAPFQTPATVTLTPLGASCDFAPCTLAHHVVVYSYSERLQRRVAQASTSLSIQVVAPADEPPQIELPDEVTYDKAGGAAPVTLPAVVSGGAGGNTYVWSPATGLDNASIAQPTASPDRTTVYELTVTDACGASSSRTITVVVTEDFPPEFPYECPIPAGATDFLGEEYGYYWEKHFLGITQVGPLRKWTADRRQLLLQYCNDADGKYHGRLSEWYENGAPKHLCDYTHGARDGLYRRWHSDQGPLVAEHRYVNGQLHGKSALKAWQTDGQKFMEIDYCEGQYHGDYRKWWNDQQLRTWIEYKHGEPHGRWREWDEDGTLTKDCDYIDGELDYCRVP